MQQSSEHQVYGAAWCDDLESMSNADDNDGGLDLSQWDFLTTTYDRVDFFAPSGTEPHPFVTRPDEVQLHFSMNDTHAPQYALYTSTTDTADTTRINAASMTHLATHTTDDTTITFDPHRESAGHQGDDVLQLSPGTTVSRDNLLRFQDPLHQKFGREMSHGMDQLSSLPLDTTTGSMAPSSHPESLFVSTTRFAEFLQPMNSASTCSHFDANGLSTGYGSSLHKDIGHRYIYNGSSIEGVSHSASQSRASLMNQNTAAHPVLSQHHIQALQSRAESADETPVPMLSSRDAKGTSTATSLTSAPSMAAFGQASTAPLAPMCPPLTAYNYFYRNERDTIVEGMNDPSDPLPPPDLNFTPRKMAELLHHHWNVDPYKKKRQHRKTHGRIEFTRLSKEIAKRWKMLPIHGREFYREVASADQKRHESYLAMIRRNGSTAVGV